MLDIAEMVSDCGGVACYLQLESQGVTRSAILGAIRHGEVERVRNSWIALPQAPPDLVRAVRIGGKLTCLSVLRSKGIWCVNDSSLHVSVGLHAGHLAAPQDRSLPLGKPSRRGVVLHRLPKEQRYSRAEASDSLVMALLHLFRCQKRDAVVASLDSALNMRKVTHEQLLFITQMLPKKYRCYLDWVDASAQSGLETKARLALRSLGIPYQTQVQIEQVGRVDLLIGDRLVLELDGERWHSAPKDFEEDRRRDLALQHGGYLVMRLSYAQVMNDWPRAELVIRALVARQEHRWTFRHRLHLPEVLLQTGGDLARW